MTTPTNKLKSYALIDKNGKLVEYYRTSLGARHGFNYYSKRKVFLGLKIIPYQKYLELYNTVEKGGIKQKWKIKH